MRSPAFYPHRPESVEVVETHISWVFLAGERVFKLRKPVVFPFLDYGTAERRRRMAEEEVRLGRRLAPTLYVGGGRCAREGTGWTLGEPGAEGGEYVVEMRRFDERRTLAALLRPARSTRRRSAAWPSGWPPSTRRPLRRRSAASIRRRVAATVSENFSTLLPSPRGSSRATAGGRPPLRGGLSAQPRRDDRAALRAGPGARLPR